MLTDRLLRFRAAMQTSAALGIPILKTKNAKSIEDVLDEHISTVTKALEKVKSSETSTDERLNGLNADIRELSQKMAQMGGRGGGSFAGQPSGSWGSQLTSSERFKSVAAMAPEDRPKEFRVAVKSITSDGGSGGSLSRPDRDEGVQMPRRPLTVRDLVTVVPTETGLVQFPRQTVRDNQAAPVAEGGLKPMSNYGWTLDDVPIRTIAHWTEASRQIMDDAPQLEGLVNDELVYGLDLVEDNEMLYGDGSGEHLSGMAPAAAAFSAPFVIPDATMIDRIGLALLQAALTDEDPDGVIVHPSDWMRIRLTKNADGEYIYGPPSAAVVPSIFGKPVVATKGILIDKFLTGPFKRGARLYDRMQTEIRISDQDRDNFVRNRLTIRAEKRVGLGKRLEKSFVYGDFGNVP